MGDNKKEPDTQVKLLDLYVSLREGSFSFKRYVWKLYLSFFSYIFILINRSSIILSFLLIVKPSSNSITDVEELFL